MAEDLTFYMSPMSRARIVRWMLEETGAAYRVENLAYPDMKSPAYLAINPMGKVPAIRHGEVVVTECAAICAYLADAFPEAGLAPPPQSPERGAYYRWLFFAAGPVEAAVTNRALGFEPPAERRGMVGYGAYADVIHTLSTALQDKSFLAGDRFSAADVYLGSQLAYGMRFGTIEKQPAFEAYVQRLTERPAAVRAAQLDDALLPEKAAG